MPAKDSRQSVIDLREATWCAASALVALTTLCQHLRESGREVQVLGPMDFNVLNYMSRMRIGYMLNDLHVAHDFPAVNESSVNSLVELSEFDGARGATEMVEAAYTHVAKFDLVIADALLVGLGETAENVHEHSGRESGFVTAQRYRDGRFLFAVGDAGIGVRASLGANTDEQAVQLALRRGATGSGDMGRGNGLPSVVDQTTKLGGTLTLVSGAVATTVRARSGAHVTQLDTSFPGTLIYGVLVAG